MSLWDDSHWVDGYIARVNHVFAGGGSAQIDFTWEALEPHQGTGRVGWRSLASEDPATVTNMLAIATQAKHADWRLLLRVTNEGLITGVQTVANPRPPRFDLAFDALPRLEDRIRESVAFEHEG